MGRYCGEDYGPPPLPDTSNDFLHHTHALARREVLNARHGGGFGIIRVSIFYRVTRCIGSTPIPDPPKCCGRWMYTQRDGTHVCLNHQPHSKTHFVAEGQE